jgi:hypothetical protein
MNFPNKIFLLHIREGIKPFVGQAVDCFNDTGDSCVSGKCRNSSLRCHRRGIVVKLYNKCRSALKSMQIRIQIRHFRSIRTKNYTLSSSAKDGQAIQAHPQNSPPGSGSGSTRMTVSSQVRAMLKN